MNMHVLRTLIIEILKFLEVVLLHRGQLSHTHTHTHIMLHVVFQCTKATAVMLIKKEACSCWSSVYRPSRTPVHTKWALFNSKKLQFPLHQLGFASSTSSSSNSRRTYFMGKSMKTLAIVTFPEQSYPDNLLIYLLALNTCNTHPYEEICYSFKKIFTTRFKQHIWPLATARHHQYGKVGTEFS